ncbi:MAG TPA: hypothetical protein VKV17_22565 [Bryobacteraceae bacterium]|nr:hypothetical protein [Bryobacteraceae bacterium]
MNRSLAAAALVIFRLAGATPAEYRQHVGIYVWGQLRQTPAGALEQAASDVKRLGADRVVRVYIGPGALWDPADARDNSPLDVKVRRADYRAFVAAFPVVMLTAYDTASYGKYKNGRLDARQLAATRDEFRRFAIELAKTPGRKIVSNWEFENDCGGNWAACREYYQARLDGVRQGRDEARKLGYPGEVLSAFEFTIVPGYVGKPSGLVEVGAKLASVDYFSYSCWASIGWDYDAATMAKSMASGMHVLRDFADKQHLSARFIIGEFGEYWDQHRTAARMEALVNAALENGVDYLFDWVLYDQPGKRDDHGRDASHFGKYTLDGALTPQGTAFRNWFAGAVH